jgi:hypothetical protein
MRAQPTPETDAFVKELHDDLDVELAQMTSHARRMERSAREWLRMWGECKVECEEARKALRIIADSRNWFHTTQEVGGPYTAWRGKKEPDEIAADALEKMEGGK